ncbi:Senescence-associated protein spa15, chloroplastic [Ancistrocladus abbreviatus]
MALTASKLSTNPIVPDRTSVCKPRGVSYSVPNSPQYSAHPTIQGVDLKRQNSGHYLKARSRLYKDGLWSLCRRPFSYIIARGSSLLRHATRTHRSESTETVTRSDHCSDVSREFCEDEDDEHLLVTRKVIYSPQGLAEACKYVCNDAKYVNERARNDIVLLSRGILSLDARARQDLAFLGSEFLKLDARARQHTGKIDHNVKKKAERLHHITTILKEKAKSRLKSAADRHWSDGALEADLRRADFVAKRRAMEDTLMALEFLKNIHDMMVSNMYKCPLRIKNGPSSANIMLEKNGKSLDFFPTDVSSDRITAIQEAYWRMASALSEADGIDYTDPEELELLITTLLDLDAMDGKSSATLLAECSSSPDVNTRRALANALATAPSMWTLGNAGMGALQRLAEDSNPAVARAASRAIHELKKQWEIEEGDSWRFMVNQKPLEEADDNDD